MKSSYEYLHSLIFILINDSGKVCFIMLQFIDIVNSFKLYKFFKQSSFMIYLHVLISNSINDFGKSSIFILIIPGKHNVVNLFKSLILKV
ncbi:ORF MSV259 hypothetical protein [Melanoplus sanguinipes entomopoxvirus]|uniref:Uncharacterized protein n=1 Tax=Melanoplus sanguinipes entomopoxvirus TaxID=83191 RepID=Q9YVI3_MSEPV|nr:ORF MSV259 hypothetical protein [Melanoplus sanguinipes entomopoxvirus]AAC97737.1 ORF MSV259 hypothetical protein [Melanoplus sanguinipes entomopoxvirus 'O']